MKTLQFVSLNMSHYNKIESLDVFTKICHSRMINVGKLLFQQQAL